MNEPTPIHNPEVRLPMQEVGGSSVETHVERPSPNIERTAEATSADVSVPTPIPAPLPIQPVATVSWQQDVEQVLSEGMQDAYAAMDDATKAKFKQTGEETATAIAVMLQQSKVQVKKIIRLILTWLRIIPNVNVYYLEQEAKIKTDTLLAMRNKHNGV